MGVVTKLSGDGFEVMGGWFDDDENEYDDDSGLKENPNKGIGSLGHLNRQSKQHISLMQRG